MNLGSIADISGATAVVLGASSGAGFGAAIAARLADAGLRVIVAGRRRDALEAFARQIDARAVPCDITDEDGVEALFDLAAAEFGPVRVAVNSAGVNHACPIRKLDADTLRAQADVHFVGTTLFVKHAARVMSQNEPAGGSIIIVSSLTASQPGPALAAYAGSKAGADHVVRIAALEYGSRQIRVNSLSPGLARTPMTEALFDQPQIETAFAAETPLGRVTDVADVAEAAVFLASPANFMTGQNLQVNGGASLTRLPTARELAGQ